jgi:hypothetical protein
MDNEDLIYDTPSMGKGPSSFDLAIGQMEAGLAGDNKGIPIPFDRLRRYLPNIQQKTYYLIGAGTKVGKTSFADDVFYYGAYDHYKRLKDTDMLDGFDLGIDYFSFEIDRVTKIIKGIGRKLWHEYGVIADANTILSKGKNHCSTEIFDLVRGYRDYFNDMEDIVTVHDMPENPTGMNKYLLDVAEQNGTIHKSNISKDHSKQIMKFDRYEPKNPKKHWLIFLDHIALMEEERGFTTKQNIDKMSQYFVKLRNNFNATPVVIQQMSGDVDNDARHTSGRLTPTLRDFGDSKYTTRDANVIMALFSPFRMKMPEFQGYNVPQLGNSFRNLEILENRDGEPGVNLGLNFIGPSGTFRELPVAAQMNEAMYNEARTMTNNHPTHMKENGIWVPSNRI